jgi:flagellar assembly factor FliW
LKVNTKAFGDIEVDDRQKITFPQGLFGFEDFHDYVLLDAERQPFYWLQSTEDVETAFVLINPFIFRPDYEANIDNEELREIGLEDQGKALIFSIVTIPSSGPITANLQGPLVINRESRLGLQAILSDPRWKTKHDILGEAAYAKRAGQN